MSSSDLLPEKMSDRNTGSRNGESAMKRFLVLFPLYSDQVQLCWMICEGFSIKISKYHNTYLGIKFSQHFKSQMMYFIRGHGVCCGVGNDLFIRLRSFQ